MHDWRSEDLSRLDGVCVGRGLSNPPLPYPVARGDEQGRKLVYGIW